MAKTVLTQIQRKLFGAPSPEEKEHDDIARQHFLKYCDSGKCPRATKGTWQEGLCTDCGQNPYNMVVQP